MFLSQQIMYSNILLMNQIRFKNVSTLVFIVHLSSTHFNIEI